MRTMTLIRWLLLIFCCAAGSLPAMAAASVAHLPAAIEQDAIDITEAALKPDRQRLDAVYRKALHEVRSLHRSLVNKPFDERHTREVSMAYSWLELVAVNLKNHSMIGAAIAANQLSSEMIRFQHSGTEKTWDIHWLGYLGRELMLLAMEDANLNAELLASRRSDALSTWQRLRLSIIRNFRNKPLVEEGDTLFERMSPDAPPAVIIEQGRQLSLFAGKLEARIQN